MGRRIVLASASPRRQALLKMIYPVFEVHVSHCTEETGALPPEDMVVELAQRKACDVAAELSATAQEEIVVIGSDTVVALGDTVLGKPENEEDAVRMLKALSGRTHSVYTGVAIVCVGMHETQRPSMEVFAEHTQVTFAPMTDEEILAYVRTGEPMDKAGAYGIQGAAGKYIASINGDYYTVVGLPVAALYRKLKQLGLTEAL